MLVLSRHRYERICIGDDIEIVVVDIRGDKVRLGIEAPKDVAVHRREINEANDRRAAAAPAVASAGAAAGAAMGPQKGPASLAQIVAQSRAVSREVAQPQ